jgi:putative DNA primase/helicase
MTLRGGRRHDDTELLLQLGLTDAQYVADFATRHKQKLSFDPRIGCWRVYNCHTWIEHPGKHEGLAIVREKVIDFARTQIGAVTPEIMDRESDRTLARAYYLKQLSHAALSNVTKAAHHATEMMCRSWDPDPWALGCSNGVVDLRTGAIRPGRPSDRIAHCAGYPYDETAMCDRWIQFLQDMLDGDDETIAWLQRYVGYALTADTSERAMLWMFGQGSNGKSTFLNVLSAVFGTYAGTAAIESFIRSDFESGGDRPSPSLVRMVGKRLIVASEPNPGVRWDVGKLKGLTGRDKIVARQLHQEEFEYESIAKFIFAMNNEPERIEDASDGFWSRQRPISLKRQFVKDDTVEPALMKEGPGILRWAIQGSLLRLMKGGLGTTVAIEASIAELRQENNPIAEFVAECVDLRDALPEADEFLRTPRVRANLMYRRYHAWAEREHRRPISQTAFGRYMSKLVDKIRDADGVYYWPAQLRTDTEAAPATY